MCHARDYAVSSTGNPQFVNPFGVIKVLGHSRIVFVANRIVQGIGLWGVMLAFVAAVLVITNFGTHADGCELTPSLATVSCFLRTYKELSSGLLGAAGAIFAAWIAWLAVQRQIEKEDLRATAKSREALEVIRNVLKNEQLPILYQIWRAVDLATDETDNEERRKDRRGTADLALRDLPPPEDLRALDRLRLKLIQVLEGFRLLHRTVKSGPADSSFFFQLQFIMSRLVTCLREFDPTMASMFEDRKKVDPEITPKAEVLKGLIESSEKGEYWH
jgi:hypothetical protein